MFIVLALLGAHFYILIGQMFPHHRDHPSTQWIHDENGAAKDAEALWKSKLNPIYFGSSLLILSGGMVLGQIACKPGMLNFPLDFLPNIAMFLFYPWLLFTLRNKDEWWLPSYKGYAWNTRPVKERQKILAMIFVFLILSGWIVFTVKDYPMHCNSPTTDVKSFKNQ